MTDAREVLVALLWQEGHAPMSTHDPRDGSCQSCPWPLHEMPPEDIANAILAEFDVTPRGERVKPTEEDVARALFDVEARNLDARGRDAEWALIKDAGRGSTFWHRQARAVLALFEDAPIDRREQQ